MYVTDKNGRKYHIPTEEETKRIRAGIAADPDTHELTDTEMAELRPLARRPGRPKAEHPKERITIRFDQDVMAAFRATGPGWQTRMNDVLREYIERQM
ncbi:BrnA antitoxin family protein [Allochromatium palmeri]|uniref:BrnA antitoxin family protein n=1 Tax=Allochromatium palmeri TaxID=231048 RepID=A0A6N8EBD9_9GAMM|nr:BrnA antitoxin family protein [Allochromatium palmeri]MTW21562.1 hypothetical protein [Allochromatium palmeri]